MFRPTADQKLDGIRSMLAVWNGEADRFRAVASAARRGEQPQSVVLAAAEEAHDGLIGLLEEIDRSLEVLPAGHAEFSALLKAQGAAIALLESVGNSLDVLAGFATDPVPEPVRIARRPALVAAE
ncbi:MAG: hypothetical protein ABI398_12910 [Devosia sp.]